MSTESFGDVAVDLGALIEEQRLVDAIGVNWVRISRLDERYQEAVEVIAENQLANGELVTRKQVDEDLWAALGRTTERMLDNLVDLYTGTLALRPQADFGARPERISGDGVRNGELRISLENVYQRAIRLDQALAAIERMASEAARSEGGDEPARRVLAAIASAASAARKGGAR